MTAGHSDSNEGYGGPGGLLIGCAGWSIPSHQAERFGEGASHLERYATRFSAVEINSSFHRPHRRSTYERWAASVAPDFRFSVKLPKTITHAAKLVDAELLFSEFIGDAAGLGDRMGALLVQLPPSLAFEAETVEAFFRMMRLHTGVPAVCEPRHASWFEPEAEGLLGELEIARVAADPAPVPAAAEPGGWSGTTYYRLHGSPRTYYSSYPAEYLDDLGHRLRASSSAGRPVWCVFDNTVLGAATANALGLLERSAGGASRG